MLFVLFLREHLPSPPSNFPPASSKRAADNKQFGAFGTWRTSHRWFGIVCPFTDMCTCYCYYYFPSLFHFVHNLCYIISSHFIICSYLLVHVHNPESEYSTPQLLTSDSRYSLLSYAPITQLLTSDSSCQISCHSRPQLCSSVLLRCSDLPRNTVSLSTLLTRSFTRLGRVSPFFFPFPFYYTN